MVSREPLERKLFREMPVEGFLRLNDWSYAQFGMLKIRPDKFRKIAANPAEALKQKNLLVK
jgi:hypothetical protein